MYLHSRDFILDGKKKISRLSFLFYRWIGTLVPTSNSMKTLYIVRHAKSSWDDSELSDFERPLNERGKADAPKMGKRLKEKEFYPDLVLSSPAKRALSTARRICKVIGFKKENIKTDRRLYHADDEMMLSVLRESKAKVHTIMMIGHNPGLTDFVNSIVNEEIDIDNIPTCGVVGFSFDTDDWNKINWGTGKFLFFDYPKKKED
jgi:phosphohistidine phosphatase